MVWKPRGEAYGVDGQPQCLEMRVAVGSVHAVRKRRSLQLPKIGRSWRRLVSNGVSQLAKCYRHRPEFPFQGNGTWMLPEVDLPMTHVLCDQYIIDKQKALASPNKPISDSENATMVMDMSSASKDVQINQGTVESGVIKIEANSSTHTPVTPLADSSKAVTQPFTTTELVQSSSSSSMTTITLPEATTSRSEGSSFSTKEDHSSTKAVTEPTTNSTSVDLTKTTPVPSSTGTTSMKPENTITGDSSTTERAATNKIHDTKNSTTTVKPTTEISTKKTSSAIVTPTPHSVTHALSLHDMGKTTSIPILTFVPYDSEPAPTDQPKPKPQKKQPRRTPRAHRKKVVANLKQIKVRPTKTVRPTPEKVRLVRARPLRMVGKTPGKTPTTAHRRATRPHSMNARAASRSKSRKHSRRITTSK
ncbi:unnamed protein product [Nippostrongylus brasiliensis]|uniref:Flocculation protein FLO11-like n=1 Tax=Nippostrongylus brasiliensis TaxID=27835 RepID=A0A0N4XIC8_NIPBR|nr:unnamed protein product [Nippostrongylus brasiliensis]